MFRWIIRTTLIASASACAGFFGATELVPPEFVAELRANLRATVTAEPTSDAAPEAPEAIRAPVADEPTGVPDASSVGDAVALLDRRGDLVSATVWWLMANRCVRPGIAALAADGATYRHTVPTNAGGGCDLVGLRGVRLEHTLVGLTVSDGTRTRPVPLPTRDGRFVAVIGEPDVALDPIDVPAAPPGSETVFGGAVFPEIRHPHVSWALVHQQTDLEAVALFDCVAAGDELCVEQTYERDWSGPCEPCIGPPWAAWPAENLAGEHG